MMGLRYGEKHVIPSQLRDLRSFVSSKSRVKPYAKTKLSSTEDRVPTNRISNCDNESYGHDHSHTHTKGQGQRSLGSKFRVETDGHRQLLYILC